MYPPARSRFPHPAAIASKHKKRQKPKPAWNENMSDLDAYKATPEELAVKKESRKSKNVEIARVAMQEKVIEKRLRAQEGRPPTASERRQIAILKEILHDQNQDELNDVLQQTDKALAMVKDMFGDNPKKWTGMPEVTRAPYQGSYQDLSSPENVQSLPRRPTLNNTRLDDLSQKLKDVTALNDLQDLDRGDTNRAMNDSGRILKTWTVPDNKENQDGGSSRGSVTDVGVFVKQLDDLKSVLAMLEAELRDYERVTGRSRGVSRRYDESLTGCTSHMADILLTSIRYVRQVDDELRSERRKSSDLSTQLMETRQLLDGITADFLMMRDEFTAHKTDYAYRMATIQHALPNSTGIVAMATQSAKSSKTMEIDMRNGKANENGAGSGPMTVPAHLTEPAYMLSPPRQRDSKYLSPVSNPNPTAKPNPHVHFSQSTEKSLRDDSEKSSSNLSEQIADLQREHEMAQMRIARLQNLQNALDTATSLEDCQAAMKSQLPLPVFEDISLFANEQEDHSGSSTHHGVPSLPGDEDATPRSIASLPCDADGMAELLGDRDVIDREIEELSRQHEMTQQQMKDLHELLTTGVRVSPAISPIPGQVKMTVHVPGVHNDMP